MQFLYDFFSQRSLPVLLLSIIIQTSLLVFNAVLLAKLFRHRAAVSEWILSLIVISAGTGVDAQTPAGNGTQRQKTDVSQLTDGPFTPDTNATARVQRMPNNSARGQNSIPNTGNVRKTRSGYSFDNRAEPYRTDRGTTGLHKAIGKLRTLRQEFSILIPTLDSSQRNLAKELGDGIDQLLNRVARFKRKKRLAELETQMKALKAEIDQLRKQDAPGLTAKDGPDDAGETPARASKRGRGRRTKGNDQKR